MKFLFVTYRWGDDIIGGAEIHHRRLVRDLIAMGHEVEVWTTTARGFDATAHWAVDWHAGYKNGTTNENGVIVRRFPMDLCGRKALQLAAKLLQRQVEREWMDVDPLHFVRIAARQPRAQQPWVHLLTNWHHVELSFDGYITRWSHPEAHLAVFPLGAKGRLWIEGNASRPVAFTVRDGSGRYQHFNESSHFTIEVPILRAENNAPDVISIRVAKPWRPLTDHRSLGLYIKAIRWLPEGEDEPVEAELWDDHRALGRLEPDDWRNLLWQQAQDRLSRWSGLFDWLRGPRSTSLRRALRQATGFDAVVAANLPWSIIPAVVEECSLPVIAMPLWHLEDDYYYWPNYIEALKKAKLILANTPFAAEKFYRPRGMNAAFVGPGIDDVADPAVPFDVAGWRAAHGIAEGEAVILSVSRKSPEKRYGMIADAVALLNKEPGRRVRFVLVGPDMDQRVVPDHMLFLGRVSDQELDAAYRACDVFALMSDTESFGMVIAEAWLRKIPVIANELCGPAASLIDVGKDGLVARDAESLARVIAWLLDHPAEAAAMGQAGREKARRDFVQRAATHRFLAAVENHLTRG